MKVMGDSNNESLRVRRRSGLQAFRYLQEVCQCLVFQKNIEGLEADVVTLALAYDIQSRFTGLDGEGI